MLGLTSLVSPALRKTFAKPYSCAHTTQSTTQSGVRVWLLLPPLARLSSGPNTPTCCSGTPSLPAPGGTRMPSTASAASTLPVLVTLTSYLTSGSAVESSAWEGKSRPSRSVVASISRTPSAETVDGGVVVSL